MSGNAVVLAAAAGNGSTVLPPVDPPAKPMLPPQGHRASTMLRQLNNGGSRRRSFLVDLQEQMLKHKQDDIEREKQREIQNLHRLLQKPPETRVATDIDTLYEWVMRNGSTNKIFQGAQEIICKTICREMTLLELPAKGAVCYQGDYGDVFFIIIQGSVSLYVETKKNLTEPGISTTNVNPASEDNKPPARFRMQRMATGLGPDPESTDVKPEIFGSFIKQIGAGGTFGELAVMDPTARRSCTILCDVNTSFICLKRAAYQRLIRITNSSQLDFTQVEFLETLYFFDRWPHSELTRVSNRLRHMTFPADSYLARIATEANLIFFIYSGVVQESIPLVHHLNDNGNVYRCTTLESESALRITMPELTLADRKLQPQRRRVALEVNLYQDHDICGEFPIVFNKPSSNTDLLAITDVKALILDRETWRDVFFMHGLDHVKEAHRRFRQLAQARESWRQTRLKLELANPGLHITLTTKEMMQDGKCMCGWCGNREHITGDYNCPALVASKQRQADKQKKKEAEKSSPTGKKVRAIDSHSHDGISTKAHVVKNTITFVNQLNESRTASATSTTRPITPKTPTSPSGRSDSPRQSSLRAAAHKIISDKQPPREETTLESTLGLAPGRPLSRVAEGEPALATDLLTPEAAASDVETATPGMTEKSRTTSDLFEVYKATRGAETKPEEPDVETTIVVPTKLEEVRKSAFPEALSAQYRQELIQKTKRITKVQQYFETRGKVLETIQNQGTQSGDERYHACQLPRKPKIPKPSRRLAMLSKNHEPKPDRFNRKINRMLKKMWDGDHPVTVVEESLRDT